MIEYVPTKTLIDSHMIGEAGTYAMAWNDALDTMTEKKRIVLAVPEEAFETTKNLLRTWRDDAKYKKEFAIADHDTSTAEIKRSEEAAYNFALQVVEKLQHYGEDDSSGEVTCSEN